MKRWIVLSGLLWLGIGAMLLYKGLRFVAEGTVASTSLSVQLQSFCGSPQQAGTGLIAVGLLIGFVKGRFILSKTVDRMVHRIRSLETPIRFSQVYPKAYWFLIGGMMGLGMLMKFAPIPIDARGLIDVAIGSSLINGAMLYFRKAYL